MKGALKCQFDSLRNAWYDGLNGETKRAAIAFPLLAVLAFIVCMLLPDLRARLVEWILATMGSMGVVNEDGTLSALSILFSNFRVCAFTMVYGLIPFIQLPALVLGVNALLLGVLAAWYMTEGLSLAAYFAAIVPHGIFELPALVLAFAMGLYVCGQLTLRCRGGENTLPVRGCLVLISRLLLLVQLPLLAAAAVMETYVTPLVASLFL